MSTHAAPCIVRAILRLCAQKINYNGYVREVISKNSSRLDLDGDVVDDAEDDSNEDLEDAHEDPYREIKIEGRQYVQPVPASHSCLQISSNHSPLRPN